MSGKMILNFGLLEHLIVILESLLQIKKLLNGLKVLKTAEEMLLKPMNRCLSHVNKKMEKLKLGLKSYRYFDQAKELADKLGVVLNESILDAHSSMALSIYSPSNLADLLTDEVEQTRDEKIAIAKQLLQEQQNSLN